MISLFINFCITCLLVTLRELYNLLYHFRLLYWMGSTSYSLLCSWSGSEMLAALQAVETVEQRKIIFPCPRSRLRIWSHETGSVVPSRVSLPILHTQVEYGAYSRDSSQFPWWRPFIYLNHHTPSGRSLIYRVKQLRTDGVHCRKSASTGPVSLKLVPVTDAAFASPWTN